MTKFQTVVTLLFGLFIVIGVIVFSMSRAGAPGENNKVLIWGTLREDIVTDAIKDHPLLGKGDTVIVIYVKKNALTFDQDLIEALADGRGPDAIFLSQDSILKHKAKIYPIPYKTFSERKFKDTFIEEGELYLFPEGALGIPFLIDPLVMYWNRDIFSNAGISVAPQYWDEFFTIAPLLTKKDKSLNITHSAVALGEYGNIFHAKEILSALIMQAGSPITKNTDMGVTSVLSEAFNKPLIPAEAALNFYTEFSNPVKIFNSWNRSLPRSDEFFTSGDLGIYFGTASELPLLREKNPNINFDVALFPQAREGNVKTTYGTMQALTVLKSARNIPAAISVALAFSELSIAKLLSALTFLPPVRRDLLSVLPGDDPYATVFYQSAIRSRGWIDPYDSKTEAIFRSMIESVTGGRTSASQAVLRADAEIKELLKDQEKNAK
ncbi:MAG: extracellular solute-binding protein [Patescibacteria group bacterium]